jgi:DNA-directed RNA polymerase specialized sigma24 family protein
MPDVEFRRVMEKLDKVIRLLAISLIAGRKRRDQMILLSKAGFKPKEIADVIGTTPNTVNVELSRLRKGNRLHVGFDEEV